jgi:hypothetical protein
MRHQVGHPLRIIATECREVGAAEPSSAAVTEAEIEMGLAPALHFHLLFGA